MIPANGSQCDACKNKIDDANPHVWKCPAYPDGIPVAFWGSERAHDAVQDDQEGDTVFEPVDGKSKASDFIPDVSPAEFIKRLFS
ncbi:hypothetical protein K8I61_17325 [bacterium]|nr:hypothetical protein [bacterium]